MFKSLFKLALRNVLKRKLFAAINIGCLALGVATCLIILTYVDFETSYDSYHENAAHLYRVNRAIYENSDLRFTSLTSSLGVGPALAAEIPEVNRTIRTLETEGPVLLTYQPPAGEPVSFRQDALKMVDSTFLRAFTYPRSAGDLATALDQPNSIVITKEIAARYFGEADPIGKSLMLSGSQADGDYQVTGVITNVPQNSHFPFKVLIPLHHVLQTSQYVNDDGWGWKNFITYVELNPHANVSDLQPKLSAFAEKHINQRDPGSTIKTAVLLQSIREIHLNPGVRHETNSTISRSGIYFFLLIAAFILAIAWINYINLSTAQAIERAQEVGIKKAIGAQRNQLIRQFMLESVVINFLGIVLAVGMAYTLLPVLAKIIGKDLSFDFLDYRLWAILVGLFVVGSLLSGSYPAFVLSSFKITDVLKGNKEHGSFGLRKVLVVFQFAASLILIAGTFGVYRQLMFMRNQDKGLNMDQVVIVEGPSIMDRVTSKKDFIRLKEDISTIPGVLNVATSGAIPGGGHNWAADALKARNPKTDTREAEVVWIDPDFIATYDIKLVAGKNFNPAIRTDMQSVLINEFAVKALGLGTAEDALKERIVLGTDTVAIVGVLKNYNWNSLKIPHTAFIFKADTISRSAFSVHLSGQNMSTALERIGERFKATFPGNPYDFYFLDDFFNRQYQDDQQFGKIFGMFSGLAIVISCLGLWGLASFTTSQKLKEIGIRKVLGASTKRILSLLSWQFMKLVLISGLIGLPLAWYGIDSWLTGFAFRIGLQWDLFAVPLVIICAIALVTVSLQILKGARSNPASILRTE